MCKKDMGHSEDFFNLTVIANVFPVKNFFYKNICKYKKIKLQAQIIKETKVKKGLYAKLECNC